MSDLIPFDIQLEIIKRLPIKSLLRFRSVSKPWKSLIDSKKFINDHASNNNLPHHLLVRYDDNKSKTKYVSVVDNDSFPQHKFPITPPESLKLLGGIKPNLVYSSHGLFCFYNFNDDDHVLHKADFRNETVVVWNPSIRKSVDIVVPNVLKWPYKTLIGFGVCPRTLHFKLVKVSYFIPFQSFFDTSSIPYQVEVYTSSSGRGWRSPLCVNSLPREHLAFDSDHVFIYGFIYWLAFDRTTPTGDDTGSYLIMSFDMASEKFSEIYFPDGIQRPGVYNISKLNDSLVLLEWNIDARKKSYDVWKMDHLNSKAFSKLFTISMPEASIKKVLGFRKSGEPIIEMRIYSKDWSKKDFLFVYEHDSKQIHSIRISGKRDSFSAISYVETLLLLDY